MTIILPSTVCPCVFILSVLFLCSTVLLYCTVIQFKQFNVLMC